MVSQGGDTNCGVDKYGQSQEEDFKGILPTHRTSDDPQRKRVRESTNRGTKSGAGSAGVIVVSEVPGEIPAISFTIWDSCSSWFLFYGK